jgi:hypothetical protein
MTADKELFDADMINKLVEEASSIVAELAKNESDALAKSDDDKGSEGSPEGSSADDAGGPPADAGSAPADAAGSSPAPDAPPADPAAGSAAPAPADAGAGDQGAGVLDPAALQAAYAAMPPDELQMHMQAIQGAAQAAGILPGGPGAGAGPVAGGPPPAPPVDPAGASASAVPGGPPPGIPPQGSPPPFGKGEMGAGERVAVAKGNEKANGGSEAEAFKTKEGEAFGKSEQDLLTKKVAELEEEKALFEKALNLMAAPAQRAITGRDMAFLGKSEEKKPKALPATRAEALTKLKTIISEKPLTKAERDLVVSYNLGNVEIEKLESIFTK